MFWSNYPAVQLQRRRLLSIRGALTGVTVVAKHGGADSDEGEAKYENSTMFISADLKSVYVLEWSGHDVEQHNADL